MEPQLAIKAEMLRKTYLKGTLRPFARQVTDLLSGKGRTRRDTTVALDDISFELESGTTLAIIGRNGSGKSTLLKILSGVTSPSSGRVQLRGRRLSILDIGTGFHPDLTGRENIYLNGAINGLKRAEVDAIFDRIVEFSEIPEFIDTPVKNYSSGMYLRLAFSIIVHLEADILLLDEVISVGDAAFQIKCMEKVREISREGRSVIMASHNVNELLSISNRVMYLEDGRIKMLGPPGEVVGEYLRLASREASVALAGRDGKATGLPNKYTFTEEDQARNEVIKLREITIHARGRSAAEPMRMDEELLLSVELEVAQENPDLELAFQLDDRFYNRISAFSPNLLRREDEPVTMREPGLYTLQCIFPKYLLKDAQYTLSVGIKQGNDFLFAWQSIITFEVASPGFRPEEVWYANSPSILGPVFGWSAERHE